MAARQRGLFKAIVAKIDIKANTRAQWPDVRKLTGAMSAFVKDVQHSRPLTGHADENLYIGANLQNQKRSLDKLEHHQRAIELMRQNERTLTRSMSLVRGIEKPNEKGGLLYRIRSLSCDNAKQKKDEIKKLDLVSWKNYLKALPTIKIPTTAQITENMRSRRPNIGPSNIHFPDCIYASFLPKIESPTTSLNSAPVSQNSDEPPIQVERGRRFIYRFDLEAVHSDSKITSPAITKPTPKKEATTDASMRGGKNTAKRSSDNYFAKQAARFHRGFTARAAAKEEPQKERKAEANMRNAKDIARLSYNVGFAEQAARFHRGLTAQPVEAQGPKKEPVANATMRDAKDTAKLSSDNKFPLRASRFHSSLTARVVARPEAKWESNAKDIAKQGTLNASDVSSIRFNNKLTPRAAIISGTEKIDTAISNMRDAQLLATKVKLLDMNEDHIVEAPRAPFDGRAMAFEIRKQSPNINIPTPAIQKQKTTFDKQFSITHNFDLTHSALPSPVQQNQELFKDLNESHANSTIEPENRGDIRRRNVVGQTFPGLNSLVHQNPESLKALNNSHDFLKTDSLYFENFWSSKKNLYK